MLRLDPHNRLVLDDAASAILRATQREFDGVNWNEANRTLTWWTIPANFRYCEVGALTKIDALMRAGIPALPLMFTITASPEGLYRSIVCVMTDRGDQALCCGIAEVTPMTDLRALGYKILYRTQVGGNLQAVESAIQQYR